MKFVCKTKVSCGWRFSIKKNSTLKHIEQGGGVNVLLIAIVGEHWQMLFKCGH